MNKFDKSRSGVSTAIFAGAVVVLAVVAATGFSLYGMNVTSGPKTVTVTSTGTAYSFTPSTGAMINNAWLVSAPVDMQTHEYAVSIHAEGLEANGTYIVEGALSSGSMNIVPISYQAMQSSMNTTSGAEFQANSAGTGTYWIELGLNPASAFENIEVYYLPGDVMSNAMLVAMVTFSMSSSSTM
jgi:hypothetical protein